MRICHLLAADTTEDDVTTIGQLLAGLDEDRFSQGLASVSVPVAKWAEARLNVTVGRVYLRLGRYVDSFSADWLGDDPPDLVHVWSRQAAPARSVIAADQIAVVLLGEMRPPRRRGPGLRIDRVLERASVVCDGQAGRDAAVRRGHDGSRCVVVPPAARLDASGADGPAPTRADLGLPVGQPVMLSPGPASREGGQYYAVWAAALLQQLFPEIRLLLPGDSPERARLERFVRSFKLPEILVCTGRRWPFRDLVGLADVLVAPALADVPTGPVVQAMSAGLPVVVSNVPSMCQRVEHGTTGLVVPAKDPTRTAGAVLRILEEDALRDRLTRAARRHVAEAYPIEAFVRCYEAVYEGAYARARTWVMGRRA